MTPLDTGGPTDSALRMFYGKLAKNRQALLWAQILCQGADAFTGESVDSRKRTILFFKEREKQVAQEMRAAAKRGDAKVFRCFADLVEFFKTHGNDWHDELAQKISGAAIEGEFRGVERGTINIEQFQRDCSEEHDPKTIRKRVLALGLKTKSGRPRKRKT